MLCHWTKSRVTLQNNFILALYIKNSPWNIFIVNSLASIILLYATSLMGIIPIIGCYILTSTTAMKALSMRHFLDVLCECPENKTFKSPCIFTIVILLFLHVPSWLLRDLHWTDSVILITEKFGSQGICCGSVSPETPFASPLPYFASKTSRGPGTKAAALSWSLAGLTTLHTQFGHQSWLHTFMQTYEPLPVFLRSQFLTEGWERER